jgi:hypothetical protein
MTGTGKDYVHLLVVCTAERGLCGAFNSSDRAFRARSRAAADERRQEVKIITVGKKGYDILRRDFASRSSSVSTCASVQDSFRFANADEIAQEDASRCSTKASSTSARCSIRELQVGDQPDSDRPAAHPGEARSIGRRLRLRAGGRRERSSAPQHRGACAARTIYEYERRQRDAQRRF